MTCLQMTIGTKCVSLLCSSTTMLTEEKELSLFSYFLITPETVNKLNQNFVYKGSGVLPTRMDFNSNYIYILRLMPIKILSKCSPKIQSDV